MKKYKYFAQHMHMHSCYQPSASMEGHIYHAANLGMKYIWFTDHDIRMGRKVLQVDDFDFEKDDLYVTEESGRSLGFKLIKENQENCKAELTKDICFIGSQCLKISAYSDDAEWKGGGVYFWSNEKQHCSSLMAGMSLEIAAMLEESADSRVIFDVKLSERPPKNECAHLLYVIGSTEGLEAAHTAIIPLIPAKGWQKYKLDLSNDVLQQNALEHGVGGLDNAFETLSIIVECRNGITEAYFDDLVINVKEKFEPVRNVQKKVAKEKGDQYGVTTFVATEISMAGPHKNCFSTSVPIIPYDEYDYKVTHEEAIEWVKKYGGIFALNHPLERFYQDEITCEKDVQDRVDWLAKDFIQHKVWGATLMEVGYPFGRRAFTQKSYLSLWDQLTEAGIILTGYGSSDNHSNKTKWYDGNNFCNWLGVDVLEAEPVSEEAFVEAMKCGRIYMGNPVVLKGNICFETEEGLQMGSVITADDPKQCQNIRFFCDKAKVGWKFRLICNRQAVAEKIISAESFEFKYVMQPEKLINFTRAELYDENGVCIMLTNPIHIWRKDLGDVEVSEKREV
ncbi:MAG: CehA/McbA family metallohydrolase [Lachnospiraceae bacterium]|nr:CehA/McbA family metallohydrolase [Lachnospiraceae bacterium]